ncbi:MAG: DUF3592 domain-containing protein [Oscillospiraceae bacterium]|nr:DUF3592 domain-containing protein [Oscillospiraceae bacterium]
MNPALLAVRLAPVLIAAVCIVLALLPDGHRGIAHPAYTMGTVVRTATQHVWSHHSETTACAPVIRFEAQGRRYELTSRHFVPEWQYRHRMGDKVRICYNARQPEQFRICRDGGEWRRGALLIAGIGTLAAYAVILWMY